MYKAAGMQWQNTSKTHTFLGLHRTFLIGRFLVKQTVQSTISEYHFQKHSSSYVAPEMKGVTLQEHLESIRVMVKQKTGRSMQEKDVEYTDKNGKVRVRKECSPIRECVVVINEDTRIKALLRFIRMVETRWGIKALQVHLHRDEGHREAE